MTNIGGINVDLKLDLGKVNLSSIGNIKNLSKELNKIQVNCNTTSKSFKTMGSSIKSSLVSVKGLMAGALGVGLIRLGKQSVDLASNLTEVQNVVDTTFTSASGQIDTFSKKALQAYGLSALSAKKYASTVGAVMKSLGVKQEVLPQMSNNLAALAGDFASFYNISQDDAFNKILSGLSGETEPLKRLGINMSVAALESYALSRGITKAWMELDTASQTMLRYNFILDKSKEAQGDFARTSNTWANQTRLLSENFKILLSTLGSGFITLLEPVVGVLNKIISAVTKAAQVFSNTINKLFGKDTSIKVGGGGVVVPEGLPMAEDNLEGVAEGYDSVGESAKKASKTLMGFDDVIQMNASGGDAVGGSVGGAGVDIEPLDLKNIENVTGGTLNNIDSMFKNSITGINNLLSGIKNPLSGLLGAVKDYGLQVITTLKDVGVSGANAFIKGFNSFIAQDGESIISSIGVILSALTEHIVGISSMFETIGEIIVSMFNLDAFSVVISNILSIIASLITKPTELITTFFADGVNALSTILSNIQSKITEALSAAISAWALHLGNIKIVIEDVFTIIKEKYEQYVKPTFDNIVTCFTYIATKLLDAYTNYIAPMLLSFGEEFARVWSAYVKPFLDNFVGFVGRLIEMGGLIYKNFVAPLVGVLIDILVPAFTGAFSNIYTKVSTIIQAICEVVGGLLKSLNGIIDFLVGAFTGDWGRAWEGIKSIFKGIWDSFVGIVKLPLNSIIDLTNTVIKGLNKALNFKTPDWAILPESVRGKEFGVTIPQIPKLARGGVVNSPTVAQIGEAGAEVVFPLQNSEFINKFASIIANMVGNKGQGGNITLNVQNAYGDAYAMQKLINDIKEALNREGVLSGNSLLGY